MQISMFANLECADRLHSTSYKPRAARKNIMKHTFKIIYETDGMPICPDAIHKQLDLAMDDIKKQFSIQYYTLPGLHKLYLEPCGDWFPEEQKPIRFKLQAASSKHQA